MMSAQRRTLQKIVLHRVTACNALEDSQRTAVKLHLIIIIEETSLHLAALFALILVQLVRMIQVHTYISPF